MRKLVYFALFFLLWFSAIIYARFLDRFNRVDSGCIVALDQAEKKYIENLEILYPDDSNLEQLNLDYIHADSITGKTEIFSKIKTSGNRLLSRSDSSNPITRKIIDEIAGAANRFSVISQSCSD